MKGRCATSRLDCLPAHHAHALLDSCAYSCAWPCRYWVLGGRRDEHFRQRWEQATDEALEQLMVHPKGW